MPVHGIDDGNNKKDVYTTEEVLSILQQAIDNGTLQGIDPEKNPIVAAVREGHNNSNITFWSGTEAEFNELTGVTSELIGARIGSDGKLYLLSGDTTLSDTIQACYDAALEATEGMKREVISVTLMANAWSDTAPYTQTVVVAGMTADKDFLAPYVVPTGNESDDLAAQAALSCISGGTTDTDSVTFYCYDEKPTTTITVFMVDKGTKLESSYPIASATNIGMVKVGDGLNVDQAGELSVAAYQIATYSFDNVAAMVAYNLAEGDTALTAGYYSANDGGAATYKIVSSGATADGGSIIALDNGMQAHLISNFITPEMFGAKGDGSTDDSSALKNAINYAIASDKHIQLLWKTYAIGTHSANHFNVHITGKCTIIGAGRDKSVIAVKSDIGGLVHVLNLDNAESVYLSGFTIDGGIDASDPTYADGVFCAGLRIDNTASVTIKDMAVRNTSGYGISLAAGSVDYLVLDDAIVENTGRDGIDFKNFDDSNGAFNISNVIIKNIGLRAVSSGYSIGQDQVGLDIRCLAANITNIRCEDIGGAASGIRARITTTEQGTGGEHNNINNVVCIAKDGCTGEGISINAVGCNINNVFISGFNVGIRVIKENVKISNAHIMNCLLSAIRQDADGLTISNVCCEKIYNTSWAMLDIRIGTAMVTNVVFGDCGGAVGVADGTLGVYLCNCYLEGTASTRFAFGSLANRTSKIHTNSTCVNITIS